MEHSGKVSTVTLSSLNQIYQATSFSQVILVLQILFWLELSNETTSK